MPRFQAGLPARGRPAFHVSWGRPPSGSLYRAARQIPLSVTVSAIRLWSVTSKAGLNHFSPIGAMAFLVPLCLPQSLSLLRTLLPDWGVRPPSQLTGSESGPLGQGPSLVEKHSQADVPLLPQKDGARTRSYREVARRPTLQRVRMPPPPRLKLSPHSEMPQHMEMSSRPGSWDWSRILTRPHLHTVPQVWKEIFASTPCSRAFPPYSLPTSGIAGRCDRWYSPHRMLHPRSALKWAQRYSRPEVGSR